MRAIAVRLVGRCVGNLTTVGSVETKPLAGRVAIVTGGTRGLGLEIARAYRTPVRAWFPAAAPMPT